MRYAWLVALAAGVAACDTSDTGTEDFETLPAEEMPAPEANTTTGSASLQVATLEGGGAYLTDARGRAVYLLEDADDPQACVDACAAAWPPFTLDAGQAPSATADEATSTSTGASIRADLIDSVQRPDGSTQVTYNGHPLYYYAQDTQAGPPAGQDVHDDWGEWYLVDPSGGEQEAAIEATSP